MGVLKVKTDEGFVDAGAALSLIGGGTVDAVLEELTITENGEYAPGAGVDGFSKVIAAIETGGGGVTIQSGSFTPAENLSEYIISVSGLVKNFFLWKETPDLTYGVRTLRAVCMLEGMDYAVYAGSNTAGSSGSGGTRGGGTDTDSEIPFTITDGQVRVFYVAQTGYLVTEQYNWVAW